MFLCRVTLCVLLGMGIYFICPLRDHPKCLSCPSVRTSPIPAQGTWGPLVEKTFLLHMVLLIITVVESRRGFSPFFQDFFFNFAPFKGLSFLLSRVLNSRAKSVMDSDVVGAIFQGLIVSGFLSSFNTVLLSSLTSPIC